MHQEHNTRRARQQWERKEQVAGKVAARLRAQARCHVCRKMSHKLEPKLCCNGLCCILENNCLKRDWKIHLKNTLKCKKRKPYPIGTQDA